MSAKESSRSSTILKNIVKELMEAVKFTWYDVTLKVVIEVHPNLSFFIRQCNFDGCGERFKLVIELKRHRESVHGVLFNTQKYFDNFQ